MDRVVKSESPDPPRVGSLGRTMPRQVPLEEAHQQGMSFEHEYVTELRKTG
jgi:hypothetical protein